MGLEVHIMLLIGLDNLLDMLASYSPDPKLDTAWHRVETWPDWRRTDPAGSWGSTRGVGRNPAGS